MSASTDSRTDNNNKDEISEQDDSKLVSLNDLNARHMRYFAILLFSSIVLYFGGCVLVYHNWWGFSHLDALYFSVISFTTIGYGDFLPSGNNERIFQSLVIIFGVGIGGSIIGIVNSFKQEHQNKMKSEKSSRLALKIQSITPSSQENDEENVDKTHDVSHSMSKSVSADGNVEKQSRTHSLRKSLSRGIHSFISRAASFVMSDQKAENLDKIKDIYLSSYDEDIWESKKRVFINLLIVFAIVGIGAASMSTIESWSGVESFYWACVTITTVGYGDVVPTTKLGRVFTIIYVLIGCGYMAQAFSELAKVPVMTRLKMNETAVLSQFTGELSKEKLESIFANPMFTNIARLRRDSSEMNKSEFVLMVLMLMNKLEENDLFLVSAIFDKMDQDEKGFLSSREMLEKIEKAKNEPADNIRQISISSISSAAAEILQDGITNLRERLRSTSRSNSAAGDMPPFGLSGSSLASDGRYHSTTSARMDSKDRRSGSFTTATRQDSNASSLVRISSFSGITKEPTTLSSSAPSRDSLSLFRSSKNPSNTISSTSSPMVESSEGGKSLTTNLLA